MYSPSDVWPRQDQETIATQPAVHAVQTSVTTFGFVEADPVNRIFLIGESPGWIDTGLEVRPQDHLTVRAGAQVCFSASDPRSCVRGGGWAREDYATEWPESAAACDDPFPELNHAAVVARVGDEVFEVGRSTLVEGKEGRLELTVNDCSLAAPLEATRL